MAKSKAKCEIKITGFCMQAEGPPEVIRQAFDQVIGMLFEAMGPQIVPPADQPFDGHLETPLPAKRRKRPTLPDK